MTAAGFRPWLGDPEKNAAWSALARVRADLQGFAEEGLVDTTYSSEAWWAVLEAEWEGWFRALGEEEPMPQRREASRGLRRALSRVYRSLGQPEPEFLSQARFVQ